LLYLNLDSNNISQVSAVAFVDIPRFANSRVGSWFCGHLTLRNNPKCGFSIDKKGKIIDFSI
jgi:hypothetical protein